MARNKFYDILSWPIRYQGNVSEKLHNVTCIGYATSEFLINVVTAFSEFIGLKPTKYLPSVV